MNEPKAKNSKQNQSETLLYVVDDEPMLLELATVILEPLGYQIKTFRDPEVALQAYSSSSPQPDVLITDYAMHAMNGLALLRACRRIRPQQKVLLVSGTVDESIYRHTTDKPDRFLAKPYQAKQLVDQVHALLKD